MKIGEVLVEIITFIQVSSVQTHYLLSKRRSHASEKSNKKLLAISIICDYGNVNTPIDEPL
jgi:hypothetical protein